MEHEASEQRMISSQYNPLKMAEYVSSATNVIDSSGIRHVFRRFCLLRNWGICNEDGSKVFVEPRPHYKSAKICVSCHLLIAGQENSGWDIYSLAGEYLKSLPPMGLYQAEQILDAEVCIS